MGKLLKAGIIGAVLWSGWWWGGSAAVERGLATWVAAKPAITVESTSKGGFPLYLRTRLNAPRISDGAYTYAPRHIDIMPAAWWPGNITVTVPDGDIPVDGPRKVSLQVAGIQSQMRIKPGLSLGLDKAVVHAGSVEMGVPGGDTLRLEGLDIEVTEVGENTYAMIATLAAVTPRAQMFRGGDLGAQWPAAAGPLRAKITVVFDRPWDRHALRGARPQPRQIDITTLQSTRGPVQHALTAKLRVDETGMPSGTVEVQLRNWAALVDLVQHAAFLRADTRQRLQSTLGTLAQIDGQDADISVKITLSGGQMRMGFLPLGPAPRLILR